MENRALNNDLARRFLLGQLSPEEQARIEELAFIDRDTFARLQTAEDELIDDFVYDELSSDEKQRFQQFFLAQSGRRQDLRIARALRQYLTQDKSALAEVPIAAISPRPKVSFLDWFRLRPTLSLVTAAFTVAVMIGFWFVVRHSLRDKTALEAEQRPSPELSTPSSSPTPALPQTTPSPAHKESEIKPSPSPRHSVQPVYAIVLAPGGPVRSESEDKKLPVPAGPVRFELPVIDDTPYENYQAVLEKEGKTIARWSNLQLKELKAGKGVQIEVQVGVLQPLKHYRIVLNARSSSKEVRTIHTYYFQVGN